MTEMTETPLELGLWGTKKVHGTMEETSGGSEKGLRATRGYD